MAFAKSSSCQVYAISWDKQNCLFYVGVSIKWVSVEWGSTLVVRFDSVY